jgi:RNA polymerase sigma-70 factor (ECF subfamily)
MNEEEIIRGCLRMERAAQRALFDKYAPEMMQLCIRYSKNYQEAKEIFLDGFKNILNNFRNFTEENSKRKKGTLRLSLGKWIKKEMIATIIRHVQANKKEYFVSSTVNVHDAETPKLYEISDEQIIQLANREDVIKSLQQLSPSYRVIYNLHEVDGYSHVEISKLLDISEYASKDTLEKAKFNIRKNLSHLILHE